VGHLVVSTAEQSENGGSLDAQEAAIRSECERRGWVLLRIERDVQSGKSLNRRPGSSARFAPVGRVRRRGS
jgi:DNA invertase Pin-like site-specific DNA recombinase